MAERIKVLLSEEEVGKKYLQFFQRWLDAGYAFVFQHCRGRGKSSGDCIPYIHEREDGLFLQEENFLDVGAPVGPAFPVVVKTLVLSKN